MPTIAADIVDAYVIRRVNARIQFLLLLRRPDLPMGNTWQPVHARIGDDETAHSAARRAIRDRIGITTAEAYSTDYINQFYDHLTDRVVLSPVLAFLVPTRAKINLDAESFDSAWCEREEATSRLLWSGQRWAIRHIDDVIGHGGPDADFYRIG
ncbi:MAG TPA: NUDIX domain-containing protein [Thermomicrobiales bacterium]|nr:NUDIX domain-containing protein [Thermomicrobiales bacterium]